MVETGTAAVRVPGMLRHYCGGRTELSVPAGTVGSALRELERREPGLYVCVCDETGEVRRHVNLFVNNDHIRDLAGLKTKLAAGDALIILPSVSGG